MNSHDIFAYDTRRATLTLYLKNTYHLPNSDKYLLAFSNTPSMEQPPAPFLAGALTMCSAITPNFFPELRLNFRIPLAEYVTKHQSQSLSVHFVKCPQYSIVRCEGTYSSIGHSDAIQTRAICFMKITTADNKSTTYWSRSITYIFHVNCGAATNL